MSNSTPILSLLKSKLRLAAAVSTATTVQNQIVDAWAMLPKDSNLTELTPADEGSTTGYDQKKWTKSSALAPRMNREFVGCGFSQCLRLIFPISRSSTKKTAHLSSSYNPRQAYDAFLKTGRSLYKTQMKLSELLESDDPGPDLRIFKDYIDRSRINITKKDMAMFCHESFVDMLGKDYHILKDGNDFDHTGNNSFVISYEERKKLCEVFREHSTPEVPESKSDDIKMQELFKDTNLVQYYDSEPLFSKLKPRIGNEGCIKVLRVKLLRTLEKLDLMITIVEHKIKFNLDPTDFSDSGLGEKSDVRKNSSFRRTIPMSVNDFNIHICDRMSESQFYQMKYRMYWNKVHFKDTKLVKELLDFKYPSDLVKATEKMCRVINDSYENSTTIQSQTNISNPQSTINILQSAKDFKDILVNENDIRILHIQDKDGMMQSAKIFLKDYRYANLKAFEIFTKVWHFLSEYVDDRIRSQRLLKHIMVTDVAWKNVCDSNLLNYEDQLLSVSHYDKFSPKTENETQTYARHFLQKLQYDTTDVLPLHAQPGISERRTTLGFNNNVLKLMNFVCRSTHDIAKEKFKVDFDNIHGGRKVLLKVNEVQGLWVAHTISEHEIIRKISTDIDAGDIDDTKSCQACPGPVIGLHVKKLMIDSENPNQVHKKTEVDIDYHIDNNDENAQNLLVFVIEIDAETVRQRCGKILNDQVGETNGNAKKVEPALWEIFNTIRTFHLGTWPVLVRNLDDYHSNVIRKRILNRIIYSSTDDKQRYEFIHELNQVGSISSVVPPRQDSNDCYAHSFASIIDSLLLEKFHYDFTQLRLYFRPGDLELKSTVKDQKHPLFIAKDRFHVLLLLIREYMGISAESNYGLNIFLPIVSGTTRGSNGRNYISKLQEYRKKAEAGIAGGLLYKIQEVVKDMYDIVSIQDDDTDNTKSIEKKKSIMYKYKNSEKFNEKIEILKKEKIQVTDKYFDGSKAESISDTVPGANKHIYEYHFLGFLSSLDVTPLAYGAGVINGARGIIKQLKLYEEAQKNLPSLPKPRFSITGREKIISRFSWHTVSVVRFFKVENYKANEDSDSDSEGKTVYFARCVDSELNNKNIMQMEKKRDKKATSKWPAFIAEKELTNTIDNKHLPKLESQQEGISTSVKELYSVSDNLDRFNSDPSLTPEDRHGSHRWIDILVHESDSMFVSLSDNGWSLFNMIRTKETADAMKKVESCQNKRSSLLSWCKKRQK